MRLSYLAAPGPGLVIAGRYTLVKKSAKGAWVSFGLQSDRTHQTKSRAKSHQNRYGFRVRTGPF